MASFLTLTETKLEKKAAPILIVNDDVANRQKIAENLRQHGFLTIEVSSPEEALDVIAKQPISILIAFHKILGSSGLDLLNKVREINPQIQRVIMGSENLPEHLTRLLQPLNWISDPWETHNLIEIINHCFERFRLNLEKQQIASKLNESDRDLADFKSQEISRRDLGSKIHKTLLLDNPPNELPGISIALIADSSIEIDGDFITFLQPSEDLFDFAIGDVMGKGLSSALIGTVIRGEINHITTPFASKAFTFEKRFGWRDDIPLIKEIVQHLHKRVFERLYSLDFFVSLFYGRLDLQSRIFSFIDCGFTKPIFFRNSTKKTIAIQSSNFPLGTVERHEYIPFDIHYEQGDFIVLYSDGVIEAQSSEGELFGEKRLAKLIEENYQLNPQELSKLIKSTILNFVPEERLEDDCLIFILKIDELLSAKHEKSGVAKFNSVLSQLDAVRKHINDLCVKAPGEHQRLSSELQLAIDEVFTNIVTHGYKNKTGQPICIRTEYLPDQMMIEISDQGDSLNPYSLPEVNLYGDRDHGYGWYLIRQISDRIVYRPKKTQNGWNHLQIYKHYIYKQEELMELNTTERDGVFIICLDSPSLDAKRVPEFKEKVLQLIKEKKIEQLIFDLQKIQFIDSSGLGAFLSLLRYMNTLGGQLTLASMNPSVKTIFELVSMQKIFDCYDTVDKAVTACTKSQPH